MKQKGEVMGIKITPYLYKQLPENPVEILLVTFKSQEEIATFCGVSPQAVWNWKSRNSIPKWHIKELSEYTGAPTWMLCPKFFKKGKPNDAVADDAGKRGGQDRPSEGEVLEPDVRGEGMLSSGSPEQD